MLDGDWSSDVCSSDLLAYRANRNTTAHDYGKGFADETLTLLPAYLDDLRQLAQRLQAVFDAQG
jgi:hypothetical protein